MVILRKLHIPAPRAKIFQAFDALPGLREALLQKELDFEKQAKPVFCEEHLEELDRTVRSLAPGMQIGLTFFENGFYREYNGAFRGLDSKGNSLRLDEKSIALPTICAIMTEENFIA